MQFLFAFEIASCNSNCMTHDAPPKYGPSQPTETTRITVDLREKLSPAELEAFLSRAREAGRTPEEHFLAITIGQMEKGAA